MRSARYALCCVLAVFSIMGVVWFTGSGKTHRHHRRLDGTSGLRNADGDAVDDVDAYDVARGPRLQDDVDQESLFREDDTQLVKFDEDDIPSDLKLFRPLRGLGSQRIHSTQIHILSAFVYHNAKGLVK